MLISLDEVVASVIRITDILCRYGGEEFLVIAPHTAPLGAVDLAERLRQRIESHNFNLSSEAGETYVNNVTISIGVVSIDDNVDSAETLVRTTADKNLYHAKQQGQNRVCTNTPIAEKLR